MEYMVLPELDGMRLRDVLRRVMGVSYTAMKSAKWNGGITVDGVVTPVDAFVRAGRWWHSASGRTPRCTRSSRMNCR